ncbi:hypothetical protein QNI16_36065 [Cytophagaceae bacterium YF14B1]|uniref:Uncharacterized protein n=2 Tax=Xanthocytophaga flava TaxID=3048013 RepID=A0AAE3QYU1_9BACT|nr:hypothetical protein [Xanthocytophaga flavus]
MYQQRFVIEQTYWLRAQYRLVPGRTTIVLCWSDTIHPMLVGRDGITCLPLFNGVNS